ncbi:uncharacterized protein [Prorops nasuta]|uniref:uncharacterized protein n=1 Tax=Prorops nasuta TaxID=863751 RepID=UPI0034CD2303
MFLCPFCNEELQNNLRFRQHVKLFHNSLRYEACNCKIENCSRTFHSIYSYEKHFQNKHQRYRTIDSASEMVTPCLQHNSVDINNEIEAEFNEIDSSHIIDVVRNISVNTNKNSVSDQISKNIYLFVAKFYSFCKMSRSITTEVIESLFDLYKGTFSNLLQEISLYGNVSYQIKISELTNIVQTIFNSLKSEYLIFKYFKEYGTYIAPVSHKVDSYMKSVRMKGKNNVIFKDITIEAIPMKPVLIQFLELPNVFDTISSEYRKRGKRNNYYSILDGEVWKNIEKKFFGKIVFPLTLYFDDFEINNPLGSHAGANKIGGIYYCISCIPHKYSSSLKNIFVVQLHNTFHYKKLGNRVMLRNLIDQLFQLEKDGITINVSGKEIKIYFAVACVIGDNLAANEILGFVTSFNSSYCCRVCLADKSTRDTQLKEDITLLRTKDNYRLDLMNHTRGIVNKCVFNSLNSFDVTENITLDIMHDILEGICRYEMRDILNELINVQKFFTLENLNSRIAFFDFGCKNSVNKPPSICNSSLKKSSLILSASEMLCLVRGFGLIIGDLVPVHNKAWKLWLLLREIISITFSPVISDGACKLLSNLIFEHNELYLQLFSTTLKPKHHFLLHYSLVIKKYGPIKHISSLRYEAKHKDLKNISSAITSRLNASHSIAIKHQMQLNYRFLKCEGFCDGFDVGCVFEKELCCILNYSTFKHKIPENINQKNCLVNWATIYGTKYQPDMALIVDTNDILLTFAKIKYVLVTEDREIYFIVLNMSTISFNNHLHAYEVVESTSWEVIKQKDLIDYSPYNFHNITGGKVYVHCT